MVTKKVNLGIKISASHQPKWDGERNRSETKKGVENRSIDIPVFPVGAAVPYGGTEDPPGWLICDGRKVNRSTYLDLFNVIGAKFGSADNQTFLIPDLQDRVPVGPTDPNNVGFISLAFYDAGDSGGKVLRMNYIIYTGVE